MFVAFFTFFNITLLGRTNYFYEKVDIVSTQAKPQFLFQFQS